MSGILAAVTIVASAAGAGGQTDTRYEPARVLRSFDLIVFHSEYGDVIQPRVRKWESPIRVFLDVRAGVEPMLRTLVERHLKDLADLTRLEIGLVERREDSNLHAVFETESRLGALADELFEDPAAMRSVLRQSVCIGRYQANKDHRIVRATIVIPPDRAASRGLLLACIIEEFAQVLGLPNDSAEVYPSVFNDRSVDTMLTDLDRLLISLLYAPAVKPGLTRAETLAVVERMLAQGGAGSADGLKN